MKKRLLTRLCTNLLIFLLNKGHNDKTNMLYSFMIIVLISEYLCLYQSFYNMNFRDYLGTQFICPAPTHTTLVTTGLHNINTNY